MSSIYVDTKRNRTTQYGGPAPENDTRSGTGAWSQRTTVFAQEDADAQIHEVDCSYVADDVKGKGGFAHKVRLNGDFMCNWHFCT